MASSSSGIVHGSLLSSTSTFLSHRLYHRASLTILSIDFSMVFTNFPKYEELKREEQQLYHFDKDTYNKSARKGGKAFYFASSGTIGETWVPLIEKAYAKLHGNYSYLQGGHECDAITDMTGFVILGASSSWCC